MCVMFMIGVFGKRACFLLKKYNLPWGKPEEFFE